MTAPLSDERIAELTYRLKGPVTNPLDWWCEADDLFTIGRELLAEVERLRALVRDLNATLVAKQQEGDRLAGNYVAIRAENQSLRDHHYELRTEVARLRARVAALEGVLRSVEWFGDTGDDRWYSCPCCGQHQPYHAPDCALDAALRGADE